MARKPTGNPTGRPRIKIDKKDFESLLHIQCSLEEITAFFDSKLGGCSEDTIERWCLREYGEPFADISVKKKAYGKISIRRAQFRMMEKNPTALIWASKQYLGQKDNVETAGVVITEETRNAIAGLLNAIDTGNSNTDSKA